MVEGTCSPFKKDPEVRWFYLLPKSCHSVFHSDPNNKVSVEELRHLSESGLPPAFFFCKAVTLNLRSYLFGPLSEPEFLHLQNFEKQLE